MLIDETCESRTQANLSALGCADWAVVSPSVVDPKLCFSDPDPALGLFSDPDSDSDSNPDPACLTKVIRLYKIK